MLTSLSFENRFSYFHLQAEHMFDKIKLGDYYASDL